MNAIKLKTSSLLNQNCWALILLVFSINFAYAQKYKPRTKYYIGGGLEAYSSGNSHGALFSPYINLTAGRSSFNAGPVFQKRSMEINGGKLAFSYNLSGSKKNIAEEESEGDFVNTRPSILQLNFFGFTQYLHNSLLSLSASKIEEKAALENGINWNHTRLSTAEAGVGFELYVRITKRVSWKSYAGGAVYYHLNFQQGMYHERNCLSLLLGTGIHICPL
ncbi:MAG: hypothetical protein H0W61_06520 [Bacteroidetes bacterium]|nr:hypothetical protein [Bacteroidota bacterium]